MLSAAVVIGALRILRLMDSQCFSAIILMGGDNCQSSANSAFAKSGPTLRRKEFAPSGTKSFLKELILIEKK